MAPLTFPNGFFKNSSYSSFALSTKLWLHGMPRDLKKFKCKVRPKAGNVGSDEEQTCISTLSSTSALDGGGWLTPRPGHFAPGLGSPSAGLDDCGESCPRRSQSLYQLSYRGLYTGDLRSGKCTDYLCKSQLRAGNSQASR